jgi:nucleoside-diphosphate-sugar epimerase
VILLTGATGFLGQYIVRHFKNKGYALRLLVRNATAAVKNAAAFQGCEMSEGDLLDVVSLTAALEGCDQVIHAGAVVSFERKDRKLIKLINETGTANLLNCALAANIQKFVHISSVAALGRPPGALDIPITESQKFAAGKYNTAYGVSKYLAEKQVHRAVAEGLPAVILSPSLILGVGDWEKGSARLFQQVWKGLSYYPPGSTSLVGAEDVATAVELALLSPYIEAERFILSAEHRSWRWIFEQMAIALGKPIPKRTLPKFPAQIYGWLAETWAGLTKKPALITRETVRTSFGNWHYSGALFEKTFNFIYTSIDTVIRQTAAAFLAQHRQH